MTSGALCSRTMRKKVDLESLCALQNSAMVNGYPLMGLLPISKAKRYYFALSHVNSLLHVTQHKVLLHSQNTHAPTAETWPPHSLTAPLLNEIARTAWTGKDGPLPSAITQICVINTAVDRSRPESRFGCWRDLSTYPPGLLVFFSMLNACFVVASETLRPVASHPVRHYEN